jgi:hypothetical protein
MAVSKQETARNAAREARISLSGPCHQPFANGVSERGDTVRFEAPRWQVTASITALANNRGETLSQLQREAQQDIIQNSHGSITYQRNGTTWFVLSGHILDRIYYQRSVPTQGNMAITNLWIEFPCELRPCMDAIVTMMANPFH